MRTTYEIKDFSENEIKDYIVKRYNRTPINNKKHTLGSFLELLPLAYSEAIKNKLWYEVKTDTVYHHREWISKASKLPSEDELLSTYEDVLTWVIGHEIYCNIDTKLNCIKIGIAS